MIEMYFFHGILFKKSTVGASRRGHNNILTQFLCSKDYGILYINANYPLIISQCQHAGMVPNFPEYFYYLWNIWNITCVGASP